MTQPEYEKALAAGQVKAHPLEKLGIGTEDATFRAPGYTLDDFLPSLVAMLSPMQHVTTPPTFTPQNLLESIQLYDDGVNRRIYVFINSTWRYTTLT